MTSLLRIVLRGGCLAAFLVALGCRVDLPMPMPDAARASGLILEPTPASLVVRPSSSGRIRFLLRDEQKLPVPDYPIRFTLLDNMGSEGTVDAQLSSGYVLSDREGAAVVEVMVGDLGPGNRPADLMVKAACPGSTDAQAQVLVTTNPYKVEIVAVPAEDLLGADTVTRVRLLFYDSLTCADLDLNNLGAAPSQPRRPDPVAPNTPFLFPGVAGQGSSAVVGLGLDGKGVVHIGGCADVPGASLFESETIRATLYLDRLFPGPRGSFSVSSEFQSTAALGAFLPALQEVWQEWGRCGLDPARLWLDCTIDALASDEAKDPKDCVPVPGAEGTLGDLLFARRGTVDSAPQNPSWAPCRGPVDAAGGPSLDSLVADLFRGSQSRLAVANLAGFSSELAAMLGKFRLNSTLTFVDGATTNTFLGEHSLVHLTFPSGLSPVTLDIATLGLPMTKAVGLLATLKNGQITIPSHAFTLRLGTSARYAFEASSLKSRGAQDSSSLVARIFSLGERVDRGVSQSGCTALDAVLCDVINRPRGTLLAACEAGLDMLVQKLEGSFTGLDGVGLDLRLISGSAPVVDNDGDGRADALGQTQGIGNSPPAGPGLWSGQIESRSGKFAVYGSFTAPRSTASP